MDEQDLPWLGAAELTRAYAAARLTPLEVHDVVQRHIDACEPTLGAMAEREDGQSRSAAAASAARWRAGRPLGPLDGVPVTLKENLGRRGHPLRLGCAALDPAPLDTDSAVAERISAAGAVVIGSTVLPDGGMLSSGVSSLRGVARSPWDPSLTTGGSSAGAGAAAAAGYGPIHLGTDIGGSIRLPATWLGVVGHKPSFGRVPLDAPYLGRVAGPLTRTAQDAALAMRVLSGPHPRDWSALPAAELDWGLGGADVAGLRVGLLLDAGCGLPVEPDIAAAVERAAALFERAGALVEPVSPWLEESLLRQLDLFWRVRSWNDLTALPPRERGQVLPYVAAWAEGGAHASGQDVLRAYQDVLRIRALTVAATLTFDLVLSPVTPVSAFPAHWPMPWGEDHRRAMPHLGFTAPFSMSGQPACSVNAGRTADGRLVGLQLAGPRFDDVGVLRAVSWWEGARPDDARPPWPRGEVGPRTPAAG